MRFRTLGITIGLAAGGLSLGTFMWWRQKAMPPPAHVAIVLDASNSTQPACAVVADVARTVTRLRGVKAGSTLSIIRTGDFSTHMEPQLIFSQPIPTGTGNAPLSKGRQAKQERAIFASSAIHACEKMQAQSTSPIVKAVRRGLSQLISLGCTRRSDCLLILHSDLRDNDELRPQGSNIPSQMLDNTGIKVLLCGYSETVRDGSSVDTDALLKRWKGMFVEPATFSPFCAAPILTEVGANIPQETYGPEDTIRFLN
jgi:hypothetical protein